MRRWWSHALVGLGLAGLLVAPRSWSQPAPTAAPTAKATAAPAAPSSAAPPAAAAPAGSAAPEEAPEADGDAPPDAAPGMPPGHPPTGQMPPGHPGGNGGFDAPQDQVLVAPDLPVGVVEIAIVDGDEQPIPNAPLTFNILKNSVTEGESREVLEGTTDELGRYNVTQLQIGSGVSYSVSTTRDGATFQSPPFGLKDQGGVRVLLHSYETVSDLAEAALVMEAIVLLEVKQDNLAVNHLLRTLNVGRKAWVATNVRMDLPPGAAGFDNGDSASGVTMVESDGQMELTGTFPPGQSEMTFRYNVPLDGSDELNVKLPLPPRVIATRVVVGAGPKMGLEVAGFPAAEPGTWQDGKRVLMTTKQARARDGIASLMQSTAPTLLSIRLTGIPNPGYGPRIALVLALLATAGGLGFFFTHRNETKLRADQREDLLEARDTLLEEFVVLEKAWRRREIGARTYQRLRGALLDALARIERRLEGEDASGAKGGKKGERSKPAKGKKARAKRAPDEAAAAKKKRTGSQAAKARG